MSITCGASPRQIQQLLKEIVLSFKRIHKSKDTLKKDLKEMFDELAGNLDNVEELVSIILNSRSIGSVKDVDPDFFSKDNITTYITGKNLGIVENSLLEVSGDRITEPEQVHLRENANLSFLNKMYGLATGVKDAAVVQMETYLFDTCFVNRGSINGIVSPNNDIDLNRNLYLLLDFLLSKITDFLNYTLGKNATALKEIPEDVKLILENPRMYVGEQYALDILKSYLDNYLSFDTSDELLQLYNDSKSLTTSLLKKRKANLKLQAYNAKVFLTHFDTYLATKKSINIKGTLNNRVLLRDKYSYAKTTSKVSTTWNENEDYVDVEEYADDISKMAINTTKYLRWNSTTETGRFLNFGQFSHIIGKIKDLNFVTEVHNIEFNPDLKFFLELSPTSLKILNGKTLSETISLIRKNSIDILPAIFELLSNNTFRKSVNFMNETKFTDDELNILYSLALGIFSPAADNSLYNLFGKGFNVFKNIAHVANTIYNVLFILYHRNADGTIDTRTLTDSTLWLISKDIENTINTNNSIKQYNKTLDNPLISNVKPDSKDKFQYLTFDIPSIGIKVKVNASSGTVRFQNLDNSSISSFSNLWKNPEVIKFLDSVLGLNLKLNVELANEIVNKIGSRGDACLQLLSFACRVLLNQYVSFNYIKDLKNLTDIKNKISEIYGKQAPDYNYGLAEMELVHKYDVPLIKLITKIKANLSGVTTSVQVKDGEGNSQGLQTTSRLLGSFPTLFLQEFTDGSASLYSLLRIPGLLENVYTAKELYDDIEGSTSSVNMNVREMSYVSFVLDFVGGLISNDLDAIVGNGHILLLPSVNSDKTTIGRIRINLNTELGIDKEGKFSYVFNREEFILNGGTIKAIKDFNSEERRKLIAQLMSTFYTISLLNVLNTYRELDISLLDIGCPKFEKEYLKNFSDFIDWWIRNSHIENGKRIGNTYGEKSPIDFIKKAVLKYNKSHRNKPLELVDLLAFRESEMILNDREKIKVPTLQLSFIAQIARFNPDFISNLKPDFDFSIYYDENKFWKLNNLQTIYSLLKANVKINTAKTEQAELIHLAQYKDWINKSGNVIFAKININGTDESIASNLDILRIQKLLGTNSILETLNKIFANYQITLHPLLDQYCDLEYLFTLEFMNCTVGTFAAHPGKTKSNNVIKLEAACFLALHKRNVSFTASMYSFDLNTLEGIPEDYNIAVIEDIKDEQSTIIGLNFSLKPFDGATYVNPFIVILENNSLGPDKAGVTKKLFVHFKNEKFGNGGIIKTAGFGLTNDWIRNSPFLELMMRKMTNHRWIDKKGNPLNLNITLNYQNKKIIYNDRYFTKNGKVYQLDDINVITLIDPDTNETYYRYVPTIYELALDENGKSEGKQVRQLEIDEIVELYSKDLSFSEGGFAINTNYELWKFFGGQYSMTKVNDKYLELSNASVENVVIAMNSIGLITDNPIKTLDLLYQPLKHSDIHYVATAGAVKQGAANINSSDKYFNNEDYDFLKIHMHQAGILLDKEHHADGSDLSLMTLVISACALNGYTFNAALGIYTALKLSTELGIKEHLDALLIFFETDSLEAIQEVLMETIIHALSTSNSENFATKVASEIIDRARSGEEIKFSELILPLSDNTIYAKIFSTINAYLTNSGIKQKIPGILSVLTPSYDVMKLHPDGKGGLVKYESFTNPEQDLEVIQANTAPVYELVDGVPTGNISDIELNRTYFVTEQIPIQVLLDFNKEYNGYSLEKAYQEIIWNRIRDISPASIKGLITKILNGNSNKSLSEIVDKLVSKIDNPEDQQIYRKLLILTINTPISNNLSIKINGKTFTEFEYLLNVLSQIGVHPEMLLALTTTNRDEIYNKLKRYSLESLTDLLISLAKQYKLQNNIPTLVDERTVSRLIRTGDDYRRLKADIQSKRVVKVVENVKAGRNLKTYNVRFGTTDGQSFLVHDLDSQAAISEFNRISKIKDATTRSLEFRKLADTYFPNESIHSSSDLFNHIRRWIQRDLMNLSNSTPDVMLTYDELLKSVETYQPLEISTNIISFSTSSSPYYSVRTKENADWSDITLALAENFNTRGELLTLNAAGDKYVADYLSNSPETIADNIYNLLIEKGKTTNIKLNIAGNGLYSLSESLEYYNNLLTQVLSILLSKGVTISAIRSGGQTGIDEAGIIAAQRLGIPSEVHTTSDFKFRGKDGKDIADESSFKARFLPASINIYYGSNENADLSNFAKRPFNISYDSLYDLKQALDKESTDLGEWLYNILNENTTFQTVEGAFLAAKIAFSDYYKTEGEYSDEAVSLIRKLTQTSGAQALSIGRHIKGLNTKLWDKYSSDIMKVLIKASFELNPQALLRLLFTGNTQLTHTQGTGKWNKEFPRILMEVRKELSDNTELLADKVSSEGTTELYGVLIDPNLKANHATWLSQNPNGIVAYRVNFNSYNTPEEALAGRIGNPFSENAKGKDTVKLFFTWLVTGNNFGNAKATEEYRQAIILKLLSTPEHSPILYYTELNRPSHATILGYLINHKELLNNQLNTKSSNQSSWYDRYARIVNIILGTGYGNKVDINGLLIEVNESNFNTIEPIIRLRIQATTNVMINGLALRVDKNTLKTDPYGLIMTKTFATAFGLKEFDSVHSIKNDPDYFIKLYIDNNATLVNPDQFAIELKRTTGKHLYLLTNRLLVNAKGLHKVEDSTISKAYVDGVHYRLDEKGNILYEITKDFKLYITDDGTEVIVTDDLDFYVNNLSYSGINLSDSLALRPALLRKIVNDFKNSNKKIVQNFYKRIRSRNINKILELNKKYNSPITRDNLELVKLENPNHPILRMGRAKWVSFLRSLQVIAARIPSQSMQSYMPMEVEAFDNPDINTAFVSTMQLLLLGSKIR